MTSRPPTAADLDGPTAVEFAQAMLPLVSRTFAPGIEMLPAPLRDQVRLGYLFCRVADTIEDAPAVPAPRRTALLRRYASILDRPARDNLEHAVLGAEIALLHPRATPEARLASGLGMLAGILDTLPAPAKGVIVRWTRELTLGMARFVGLEEGRAGGWTALATRQDLRDYEYAVAGTVGAMLHELIHIQIGEQERRHDASLADLAVSFGRGLQGVNILQDISDDRARGWSYLPEEVANRHGTATSRLHEPGDRRAAQSAVREMAEAALADLDLGLRYILELPRRRVRIRIFCLWPLLFAVRTLAHVVSSPEMLVRRVRITRGEVRALGGKALARHRSNEALRRLYAHERALLLDRLNGPAWGLLPGEER